MTNIEKAIAYLEKYNNDKVPTYLKGFDAFRFLQCQIN